MDVWEGIFERYSEEVARGGVGLKCEDQDPIRDPNSYQEVKDRQLDKKKQSSDYIPYIPTHPHNYSPKLLINLINKLIKWTS